MQFMSLAVPKTIIIWGCIFLIYGFFHVFNIVVFHLYNVPRLLQYFTAFIVRHFNKIRKCLFYLITYRHKYKKVLLKEYAESGISYNPYFRRFVLYSVTYIGLTFLKAFHLQNTKFFRFLALSSAYDF